MEATQQHLTTIAEFMGWVYEKGYTHYRYDNGEKYRNPKYYPVDSFDTMRMVLDELRSQMVLYECDLNTESMIIKKFEPFKLSIISKLYSGDPSDCAARLAEAIEWWKSVE